MGEGFEKSYVPLYGGRGIKNCQTHPYVINDWPLNALLDKENCTWKLISRTKISYELLLQRVCKRKWISLECTVQKYMYDTEYCILLLRFCQVSRFICGSCESKLLLKITAWNVWFILWLNIYYSHFLFQAIV